jgi:hypothetical protein
MSQSKLRNGLFVGLSTLTLSFLVLMEALDWFDSGLVVYGMTLTTIFLCVCFWAYWWTVSDKRPSAMFLVVGALFLCVGYSISWQFYARWLFLSNPSGYVELVNTFLWQYRVFPELVLFLWLFCWVVGRFFGTREKLEESAKTYLDEKFMFFRAQGIFQNESQIFRDAQQVFREAQTSLSRAQHIFSRAQEVFSQAQKIFDR